MRFIVDLQQMASVDVSVSLRRRQAGVPEQLLDGPEVRAPLQEMRGEAVPQGMGADPSCKCHGFHALRDEQAYGSIAEAASPRVDEQGVRPGTRLAADREIRVDRGPRATAKGDDPFLSAFTQYSDHPARSVDLTEVETHELRAANPRGVEKLEDGATANGRAAVPGHLDQEGDIRLVEVGRHSFLEPRRQQ